MMVGLLVLPLLQIRLNRTLDTSTRPVVVVRPLLRLLRCVVFFLVVVEEITLLFRIVRRKPTFVVLCIFCVCS